MISSVLQELQRKTKRRKIEYIFLIAVQAFFVGSFSDQLQLIPSCGLIVCTCGLSWTLTQYRQKRNTLPERNTFRVVVDTLETLGLLLFVTLFSIAALSMHVELTTFNAHVSLMLASYFGATLLTETYWFRRIFPTLNSAQQLNYVVNLNSSILFPFQLSLWKKTFTWKKGR